MRRLSLSEQPNHLVIPIQINPLCGALAATSANISGHDAAHAASEIRDAFGTQIDLILDGGFASQENPSTVIRVVDGDIVVLREGMIRESELRNAWSS